MSKRTPIIIYGATGYTGELIVRELERRGAAYAIAGRNRALLESLQGQLPSRPEVLVADVLERDALLKVTERAEVILSCAGPFVDFGPPVQDAALTTDTHFLDISGEARYLTESFSQKNDRAQQKGIAIINAVGFDVIATDFPAWLACQGLDDVQLLELGVASKGGISNGTRRSALRAGRDALGYENGELKQVPSGTFTRTINFPSPVGSAWCVSLPWGDVATAPRSTGAKTVRVFFKAPAPLRFATPFFSMAMGITAWKPIRKRLLQRMEKGPQGPDAENRSSGAVTIWAQATSRNGQTQVVTLTGPSGYDFTALVAAEAVLRTASPDFKGKGVLTPSQAFDVHDFLDGFKSQIKIETR